MVAYLEKTDGNVEFHEIIDFLMRSSIYYALTVIASKPVTVSEALIRSDLLFDNADGIDSLPNQAIFDAIQLMGPSHTLPIPDPIPEGSGGNQGGQSSSDRSLSGNEDDLTLKSIYDLVLSLCTQVIAQAKEIIALKAQIKMLKKKARPGRKSAKAEPSVHKDQAFDDLDEFGGIDYMETDVYQEEGVSTDKPEVSTDQPKVSIDKQDEGTDSTKLSTDKVKEGTADEPKESTTSAAQTMTPTPTSTTFGDDETIAQVLLNMSQAKAVSKEKEKGVEIRNVKDAERARTTSTRSVLTLRPLPKIDPKDKGKKVLEEEVESEAESDGVSEAKKKFKQVANDEEVAIKVQEEWEAEEERKRLAKEEATKVALSNEYDFIQARIEANRLLAERIQEAEREQFIVKERAKFLHDTIAAQKRFLAQ
ncbi:hypothetical protein Tco_1419809 [Tanacetum coccineum]